MYIPSHFEVNDKKEIFEFIKQHSFAQLTSKVEGRLFASHLPLLLDEDKAALLGHLARKNPQYTTLEGQEVLITFQGPHDYISPSWYSSPGVPTWDYQAVHVYAQCKLIDDDTALMKIVEKLTQKQESSFENPWQVKYNPSMLKAIVGFELKITDVQCQYKLSQNRSDTDKQQVIENLKKNGSSELALAIARNLKEEC